MTTYLLVGGAWIGAWAWKSVARELRARGHEVYPATLTGLGGRWSVLPLLFVLLSSYGFIQGNTMAGALNVDPRRAGAISAVQGAVSFGVGAVASNLAGLLHDGTPRPMALVMLLALAGSAAALHALALPKRS